jgi:hypothetical protein
MEQEIGIKFDSGKLDWTLMVWESLEYVVKVLMCGEKKYSRDNWKLVPNAEERYKAAAMRHLTAIMKGEYLDPETGLPHFAHVICCCLFSMWLKDNKKSEETRMLLRRKTYLLFDV